MNERRACELFFGCSPGPLLLTLVSLLPHAHADYTARLIGTLNTAAAGMGLKALLKILIYGDGKDFSGDASSVIWLKG
jgi:hypothetical protein